jgi:hypothetical protein
MFQLEAVVSRHYWLQLLVYKHVLLEIMVISFKVAFTNASVMVECMMFLHWPGSRFTEINIKSTHKGPGRL